VARRISQFMWGYQGHFRSSVNFSLQQSLEYIGADVEADLLLVGFHQGDTEVRWPICIEPEVGPYHPRQFESVLARAAVLYGEDPERQLIHTDRRTHQARQAALRDRARAKALEEALGLADPDFVFKAGFSARVVEYEVHPVVRLGKAAWDALPRLSHELKDRMWVTRSLPDGVITEVLRLSSRALLQPEPGDDLNALDTEARDIGRAAGSNLTFSAALLTGEWFARNLMDELTALANTPYERRVGSGELIIARDGHTAVQAVIRFEIPLVLRHSRSVRKALEMCSPGLMLLTDGRQVFGLGRVTETYDTSAEDLFTVRITGSGTWQLHLGTQPLLRLEHGKAELPFERLIRAVFEDIALRRIDIPGKALDLGTLWELAETATRQIHGTMIIVSSEAEAEARRLQPQALAIVPTRLTPELIAAASSIDGAVLLDPAGVCHALGVIVDGLATGVGDSARGSRFNSAIRYLRSNPPNCIILIVSEDGMIDILPKLRPRIHHRQLHEALDELSAATKTEDRNPERFADAWDRVKKLAFYMNSDMCESANLCWRFVDERRDQEGYIRILEDPLEPNPEMDDSYFLD
jgi:hypothetical protein